MSKIAIVVQGASTNVEEQKTAWRMVSGDLIFSTWVGEESKYTEMDKVVYSEPPAEPGPANFNYQMKSTVEGLKKAKELGYTHALKIRGDLIPTAAEDFLNLFKLKNSIYFLCWHAHRAYPNCPGYLVDYLTFGTVDDLLNLWSIDNVFYTVPEILLTQSFIDKFEPSKLEYFLDELNPDNNLYWIKRNVYLDTCKILFADPYDKHTFNETKDPLKGDYIKRSLS